MGSGTVAVSAVKNKCNFIGFELSEEYYKASLARVGIVQSEPSLF
jgi:DNA modification methylase